MYRRVKLMSIPVEWHVICNQTEWGREKWTEGTTPSLLFITYPPPLSLLLPSLEGGYKMADILPEASAMIRLEKSSRY